MPKPVTTMEFMRSASWIAKHCADWVGGTACNVIGDLDKPGEHIHPETLARFRATIMAHLDTATGHED